MNQKLKILEKAFKDFERDVELLESLESELKQLNTYGFEEEVKEIKIRLKDTSQILFISLKLKELKEKINKREKAKKEQRKKGRKRFLTWWKKRKKDMDKVRFERQRQKELKRKEKEKLKVEKQRQKKLEGQKKEEGKLTKEQVDKIEQKVEESSHERQSVKDALKELGKGIEIKQEKPLTKEQIEKIETKVEESIQHKMPTVLELVQQTRQRFAPQKTMEKISKKEDIINTLKETFIK